MKKKRIQEAREKAMPIATKLLDFYQKKMSELRPHFFPNLDVNIFKSGSDKQDILRENSMNNLLSIISSYPTDFNFFDPSFLDYFTNFIKNAQILHNRSEFALNDDKRIQYLSRGNASDLIEWMGVSADSAYLSCVINDPTSERVKEFGTGWSGDFCAVFSLERFASQCVVFRGDVDQPSHEGPVQKRTMDVYGSIPAVALNNYKNMNFVREGFASHAYDELLLIRRVDFNKDPLQQISINANKIR